MKERVNKVKNIVLCRIDDRLIHGQVVTSWVKQTSTNLIIIVDDALVNNTLMTKVLRASAPPGITVAIKTTADAISFICDGEKVPGENIMILVKTPQVVEDLIAGGVTLDKVILGGMGNAAGRSKFNRNVSASPDEVACLKRILAKTPVFYQLVPTESAVNIEKLIH